MVFIGHKIYQNGIRPLQDNLLDIKKLKTENEKINFPLGHRPEFVWKDWKLLSTNEQFEANTKKLTDLNRWTYESVRKLETKDQRHIVLGAL